MALLSFRCRPLFGLSLVLILSGGLLAGEPITHGFLATGGATYIRSHDGTILWQYPHSSRDGEVLEDGSVLLALSKSKAHPGGAAAIVDKSGKITFLHEGTQTEVNTVQMLKSGAILMTEAGAKPRILEVNLAGKILAEVAIQAQTKDHHLQSRMTRKLQNGNYLVPQLLDEVVREYTPEGKIVWEVKTPYWPFTAIRLPDGNTLIGCTLKDLVIEVDSKGKLVWQIDNTDLGSRLINDACGVQRLPNGNTVITSHHAQKDEVRLIEVNRDKKLVWAHKDKSKPGIHHFQILDTAGQPLPNQKWR